MKILVGKEIIKEFNFNGRDHKISLEDDRDYKETKIEPKFFCWISKEDALKMIKFIRDTQILCVDNEAVKLMYKLKEELTTKIKSRITNNLIYDQH